MIKFKGIFRKMMKFRIIALEQIQKECNYVIEAKNRQEAEDIIYCGGGKPLSEVDYNFEVEIKSCKKIK